MKKKQIIIAACAVVAVGVAAVLGWYFLGGGTDDGTGVYVQPVSELNMAFSPSANRFAGVVESQESTHVDPQSGKKVAQLLVKEGDTVTEGQALFRYDTDAIRLDIQQAELDIELSGQTIESIREDIKALENEAQGDGPESQMAAARIQEMKVNIAREEYAQKQKRNELARLQASLKDDTVKSPVAGTVRAIDESVLEGGGYDVNGNETHYITITASGDFRIKGTVSELYIMNLYEGQPMTVYSRVNDDTWTGVISRIDTSRTEENNNGYYGYYYDGGGGSSQYAFYVELSSTEGLMMGQHVTLSPDNGGGTDMSQGLWLSAGWFTIDQDGTATVWMRGTGGRLTKQSVTLGEYNENADCYRVDSGLSDGDYIAWPGEECVSGAKTTTTYNPDGDLPDGDLPMDDIPMDDIPMDDIPVDDGGMVDGGGDIMINGGGMPVPEAVVPMG